MSSIEIRVNGRYRLGEKIYKGKFSSIYIGKNVQSGQECAIKCEPKTTRTPIVLNQGKILQHIQGGIGVPNLHWHGPDEDFNFIVTDLLGNSLEDYFNICNRQFSLKTVLMIADQVINNIEYLHFKGYLHRDIKPQNFLMGLGKKLHQIYTIDYGNATSYVNPTTKQHVPLKEGLKSFYGTLRYASRGAHEGVRQSRRDDLQSLGYMLIYLCKGTLPWMGMDDTDLESRMKKIHKMKVSTKIEVNFCLKQELCEGLPIEFQKYMKYCLRLQYDEKPDYSYLKRLFKEKFISEGYEYDYIFDWILIPMKLKDIELSSKVPLITSLREEPQSLSYFNMKIDPNEEGPILLPTKDNVPAAPIKDTKKNVAVPQPPKNTARQNIADKKDCCIF